ncbi:unnamed protein product [Symbiodinium sp. CCMP2592]|nr:unnamed protein product [Symbiodinium sp. CCMP2592]
MSVREVLSLVWREHFFLHHRFDEAVEPLQTEGWTSQGVYFHWGAMTRQLLLSGCVPPQDRLQARLQLQRAGRLFASKGAVRLRDRCRITAELLRHDGLDAVPGFYTTCLPDMRMGERVNHGSDVSAMATWALHNHLIGSLDQTKLATYQRIRREIERLENEDNSDPFDEESEESDGIVD